MDSISVLRANLSRFPRRDLLRQSPAVVVSWFVVIVAEFSVSSPFCSAQEFSGEILSETFASGAFDRTAWQIDFRQLPTAKFEIGSGGLIVQIPPEATGGKRAEFRSKYKLAGDFDVSLEYTAGSFPTPETSTANLDIWINGTDGEVAFRRTNHATRGSGFAIRSHLKGSKVNWSFVTRDTAQEARSELVIRRRGTTIQFLAKLSPDDKLKEIGSVPYAAPVDDLRFRVDVERVDSQVEVVFHAVNIKSERLWRGPIDPGETSYAKWVIGGIVFLLVAGGVVFLIVRKR